MGKSCWIARLALQQHLPIQILLVFLRFKLTPDFIFRWYRPQTWQFYLFFPALSISGIHKVPVIYKRRPIQFSVTQCQWRSEECRMYAVGR